MKEDNGRMMEKDEGERCEDIGRMNLWHREFVA